LKAVRPEIPYYLVNFIESRIKRNMGGHISSRDFEMS
jgi:hypothetical protein